MASALNMGGHVVTNVGQPASAGDLVTKGYARQCCWFDSS
jgi:hypothetical protein